MKKVLVVLLVIVILAGAGVYFFMQKEGIVLRPQFEIEEVLPQEPLMYTKISDVDKNLTILKDMPLWNAIASIDFERVMGVSEEGRKQWAALEELRENLFSENNAIVYEKFFSKEVAVATYPAEIDFKGITDPNAFKDIMEDVFSKVFIVTRLRPDAQLMELISRSIEKYSEEVETETKEYEGQSYTLVSIQNTDAKLAYTRFKDILFIGVGEKAAKSAIDIYNKVDPSLAKDQNVNESFGNAIGNSGFTGYFNFEYFFEIMERYTIELTKMSGQSAEEAMSQVEQFFKSVQGFKDLAYSANLGELSEFKFDVNYDKNELTKEVAKLYASCKPTTNQTLKFIPKDILGYQWGNCFDLGYYWNELKKEWENAAPNEDGKTTKEVIEQIEAQLGLNLEKDVIEAFGQEFGGFVSDIKTGGIFPVPEFTLFIEAADKDKITNILSKLTRQPFLILQEDTHKDVSLNYLVSPIGELVEPSYCFIDDYFLLSINRKTIKSAIDAYNDKNMSLVANEDFKGIDRGLTDKNTGVQFVKVGEMIDSLQKIIKWSNSWVDSRNQQKEAFKAGSQKRLDDIVSDLAQAQKALTDLNAELEGSTDSIAQESLKQQIREVEDEIASYESQKAELEDLITGYDNEGIPADQRQVFIDDVIFPILDGMKDIKAIGSWTRLGNDTIETKAYFKR